MDRLERDERRDRRVRSRRNLHGDERHGPGRLALSVAGWPQVRRGPPVVPRRHRDLGRHRRATKCRRPRRRPTTSTSSCRSRRTTRPRIRSGRSSPAAGRRSKSTASAISMAGCSSIRPSSRSATSCRSRSRSRSIASRSANANPANTANQGRADGRRLLASVSYQSAEHVNKQTGVRTRYYKNTYEVWKHPDRDWARVEVLDAGFKQIKNGKLVTIVDPDTKEPYSEESLLERRRRVARRRPRPADDRVPHPERRGAGRAVPRLIAVRT